LVKMFQTQLFKKSFITTSLLIIQRGMNDKIFLKGNPKPDETPTSQSEVQKPAPVVPFKKTERKEFRKPVAKPVNNNLESLAI
jgi:hypothetical protein